MAVPSEPREPRSDENPQPYKDDELCKLNPHELRFGTYNRPISHAHVEALVLAYQFRPQAMPVIECNMRDDNGIYVVNGQHRTMAARQMGWDTIEALVHFGWTEEQEARAHRDSARAKLPTALDRWWSDRLSKAPDVLAIQAAVEEFGQEIPRVWNHRSQARYILCPDALLGVAYGTNTGKSAPRKDFDVERVRRLLAFILETWPQDDHRWHGMLVKGLGRFFKTYWEHEAFSIKEANKKLRGYDCAGILNHAKSVQHSLGIDMSVAMQRVLVTYYDKTRRHGRLQPREEE